MASSAVGFLLLFICIAHFCCRKGRHTSLHKCTSCTWYTNEEEYMTHAPTPLEPRSIDHSGRPLEGLHVLELGSLIAGPFATRLLAEFGAEVIKIETPGGAIRYEPSAT